MPDVSGDGDRRQKKNIHILQMEEKSEMAHAIKRIQCKDCGSEDQFPHEDPRETVECRGTLQSGKTCGKALTPSVTTLTFPQMFRAGEMRTIRLTPKALALPLVKDFPVKEYHGEQVGIIKDGPDNEGLVDIMLPYPFISREGAKTRSITTLAVPHGMLI